MKNKIQIQSDDLKNIGRGLLMGGADAIPGVSGGTVALILGVYQRLVTGISHFDLSFTKQIRNRQFSAAAAHVDFRFLATLGAGIVFGFGLMIVAMHYLMQEAFAEYTRAAFFGLIVASSVLVAMMVRPKNLLQTAGAIVVGLIVAGLAYWLVGLPALTDPPKGNLYLFFCAMIAICAMILPGISGAFILVVLGQYKLITGLVKDLTHFHFSVGHFVTLAVFALGCVAGLLSFSRVLRWLLATHHGITMTVLCGLMVGSLRKIWPFQYPSERGKELQTYLPDTFDSQAMICLVIGVVALVSVFAIERVAHGTRGERRETRG